MSAWKDDADVHITDLLRDEIEDKAPFVTGWTLVATFVDDEGDSCVAFNCMGDQRRHQTLGMLNHVLKVEEARLFWDEKPDDD
jgi:hypothetical protein